MIHALRGYPEQGCCQSFLCILLFIFTTTLRGSAKCPSFAEERIRGLEVSVRSRRSQGFKWQNQLWNQIKLTPGRWLTVLSTAFPVRLSTDLHALPVRWVTGPLSLRVLLQQIIPRNPCSNMSSCSYCRWFVFIIVALKHTNGKVVKTL